MTILPLRAPSFKGRGVPPATSYLSRYLHSLSRFFFLSRCAAFPARLRVFLFSSFILRLSLYLFSFSFPYRGPIKEGAALSPSISILFYLSPIYHLSPFLSSAPIYIARPPRCARPQGMQNKQRKNKKPRAFKHAA